MDTIFYNGKIKTMDSHYPLASAVAVKDGLIAAIGGEELLAFKTPTSRLVDLKGRLMLPGFGDSHMHALEFGESLVNVDLNRCSSIEQMIATVKSFILDLSIPAGGYVVGRGWDQEIFAEKRLPTRWDLDRISTRHPIVLTRTCGHMAVANSKALEIYGITAHTPQPEGGAFQVDEYGEPTGIFTELAINLVAPNRTNISVEDSKESILRALEYASSKGITSIHTEDLASCPGVDYQVILDAYEQLAQEGRLPVRVYEQCLFSSCEELEGFINKGYIQGIGDEFFKIGPLKIIIDGSLGARTAYMRAPYKDDPSTRGIEVVNQKELNELVLCAQRHYLSVAIHAIGDKAVEMALDSIEHAQEQCPHGDLRHGIVHCQITDHALLERFSQLGVQAYIQPVFVASDMYIASVRVGKELARTSYNWRSLYELGVHISGGSDCPIAPLDVLQGIYCAVTRKDLNGNPPEGWYPEQCLSVEQAVELYTKNVAWASYEEKMKGTISFGKYADMVVLDQDIFQLSPEEILTVNVDMTIMDGVIRYLREEEK